MADAHIAAAEKSIAQLQADVDRQQQLGKESSLLEETLRTSIAALEEFRRHRDVIISTIEGIQKGELPSA